MKKLMLSLAAVGMLFTACSDDAPDQASVDQTVQGDSYIRLQINMPQEKASRAANDNFADGTPAEYIVKNATLILFKGAAGESDPGTATFAGAYPISTDAQANSNEQIDATIDGAVKVLSNFSYTASDKIYALVVLNNNNLFTVGNGGALTLNSTSVTNEKTFTDFSKEIVELKKLQTENGGFLMTNARLTTKKGDATGSGTTSVLVDVTKHIEESEAAAQDNPVDIYVERAAAKVNMILSSSITNKTVEVTATLNGVETTYSCTFDNWKLVNKAPNEYLVHQFDDSWLALASNSKNVTSTNKYRFSGTNPITIGSTSYYRTYFANTPFTSLELNPEEGTKNGVNPNDGSVRSFGNSGNSVVYTTENTMTVENMRVRNATIAVVQVTFTVKGSNSEDLFIINGYHDKIYNKEGLGQFFAAKNNIEDITEDQVLINDVEDSGKNLVTVSYKKTQSSTAQLISDGYEISKYDGGVAYYEIPIKHFGDELTPWNNEEDPLPSATAASAIDGSYPTTNRDGNYLGRWGLVRNNWYQIEVSNVLGLGLAYDPTPVIPDDPTPLDELNLYIKCRVNILSWAKRTQSEVLK